jgi:hypothetical protein
MAKAPKEAAQSQRKRFIEAARAAGADEDEERFEQRLKAVAGANSIQGAKPEVMPGKAMKKK